MLTIEQGGMSRKEWKRVQKAHYHSSMRKKPSSATTGRIKGIIASPTQKGICRRNRSYKNPAYEVVMASLGKRGLARNQ